MKSNRRSLFLFGKGVEGEMKWGTLTIACTPVHWELQSQHKDVCHVLHFWGLAQKTLSESRADGWCGNAERMCVCACMGKNVKGGGWDVHAEVFPCSTAQGLPEHTGQCTATHRCSVCTSDSVQGMSTNSTGAVPAGTGGSELTHLLLGPLHIFVQSSLSTPGHIKLPSEAVPGKLKHQLRVTFF